MKTIYIILSATPYKIGRMIRTVLRNPYNHASLAFDEDLSSMYSFARFHINVPLYGGFVAESPRRYFYNGHSSRLKIFRLEIPEGNYRRLRQFVSEMESNGRKYIYNTYSAMVTPLHKRLRIRDSYTCVEFVGDALNVAGLEIPRGAFHSLQETERLLEPYVIYEGPCEGYMEDTDWGGDRFPEKMGRVSGAAATVYSLSRLTARAVLGMLAMLISNG